MSIAPIVNQILSILTIIAQVIIVLLIISLITKKSLFPRFLAKRGFVMAFIVAVISMLGSLTYSNIIGYEPCELCWFQRILMYPQVILLGMAMMKRDFKIASYSIVLSVIGALIAIYNYLLQIGAAPPTTCSVVGYSASCSQQFVLQYGYITIPMMALSAFILIILFLKVHKKNLSV